MPKYLKGKEKETKKEKEQRRKDNKKIQEQFQSVVLPTIC
jgi:hypothetical protein